MPADGRYARRMVIGGGIAGRRATQWFLTTPPPSGPISLWTSLVGAEGLEPPTLACKGDAELLVRGLTCGSTRRPSTSE